MATDPFTPTRTWRDIARELTLETDRGKVTQLAEELNQALLDKELLKYGPNSPALRGLSG